MAIIDHAMLPEIEMRQGIQGKFLSHQDLGAAGCSLLVNTVEPGVAVPLHKHTVEETMLVLEGSVMGPARNRARQRGSRPYGDYTRSHPSRLG